MIVIVGAGILLYPGIWQSIQNSGIGVTIQNPLQSTYIEVKNVKITSSPQSFIQPQPRIEFTVKNLANDYLDVVGIDINEKQYGIYTIHLPPGQTLQPVYFLNNFNLISQHTYNIKFTFTMATGKYQTITSSFTMPAFRRSTQLRIDSMTQNLFGTTLRMTILNTGDLPIIKASYSLNNNLNGNWLIYELINSGGSSTVSGTWNNSYFVKGSSTVTVNVTYSDGSTNTLTGQIPFDTVIIIS